MAYKRITAQRYIFLMSIGWMLFFLVYIIGIDDILELRDFSLNIPISIKYWAKLALLVVFFLNFFTQKMMDKGILIGNASIKRTLLLWSDCCLIIQFFVSIIQLTYNANNPTGVKAMSMLSCSPIPIFAAFVITIISVLLMLKKEKISWNISIRKVVFIIVLSMVVVIALAGLEQLVRFSDYTPIIYYRLILLVIYNVPALLMIYIGLIINIDNSENQKTVNYIEHDQIIEIKRYCLFSSIILFIGLIALFINVQLFFINRYGLLEKWLDTRDLTPIIKYVSSAALLICFFCQLIINFIYRIKFEKGQVDNKFKEIFKILRRLLLFLYVPMYYSFLLNDLVFYFRSDYCVQHIMPVLEFPLIYIVVSIITFYYMEKMKSFISQRFTWTLNVCFCILGAVLLVIIHSSDWFYILGVMTLLSLTPAVILMINALFINSSEQS